MLRPRLAPAPVVKPEIDDLRWQIIAKEAHCRVVRVQHHRRA